MPIVFDEVVGNVQESGDTAEGQRPAAEPAPQSSEPPPEWLERELRLLQQRKARLMAD